MVGKVFFSFTFQYDFFFPFLVVKKGNTFLFLFHYSQFYNIITVRQLAIVLTYRIVGEKHQQALTYTVTIS